MIHAMYKRRRILGTFLGVALATLLPGVSVVPDDDSWMWVAMGACVFLVLNQLIYTYPSDIRNAHPVPLLILAALGMVQDTLIWLLFSWLDFAIHVDGFLTALLAGAIVRVSVLALLPFGPQPTEEAS